MPPAALIDGACLLFAAWTLLCHLTVFLGGNLYHLLAAFAVVLVLAVLRRPKAEPAPGGRALWALGLLCAAVALIAHRPDHDDGVYMSLAAGTAEFPGRAILSFDATYGIPGLPISFPPYKVHSIETFYGALSWLLRIPVLAAAHLVSAPLWSFLTPFAFARLFGALDERRALWGAGAVTALLVLDGSGHACFGNLAFVRMFQGKSAFLCVFAPLTAAYALLYMEAPSSRRWLLLAAALVSCVGMSSSALWAGPVLAALALAAGLRKDSWRTAFLGATAAAYPAALALALRASVHDAVSGGVRLAEGMEGPLLSRTAFYSVGTAPRQAAVALALAAAAALSWPGAGARLLLLQLAAFLALFNPWTAAWTALHLTSVPAYYRVFWILPLPLAAGLLGMAADPGADRRRRLAAGLGLAFALVPTRFALAPSNGVRLGLPGLKVPAQFPLVKAVNAALSGRTVMAPLEVSNWLVTENRHAFPLLAKPTPYDSLALTLGFPEMARRERLMSHLGGERPAPLPDAEFEKALSDYSAGGVVLTSALPWAPAVRTTLGKAGFVPDATLFGYELWTRRP